MPPCRVSPEHLQRLPYGSAKTVLDVPCWRRGLGTATVAPVRCGDADTDQHPQCSCIDAHLGDCRNSDTRSSVLPWTVYPYNLLRLRCVADLYIATRTRA